MPKFKTLNLSGTEFKFVDESKIALPEESPNGTSGQLLRTNGDGTTAWVDEGLPTDEQTADAVSDWLDEHPEATTTVQDGAVSYAKLNGSLQENIDDIASIKEMLAPTEATSTASAAHAKGSYFIYGGVLYVATADIASGGTITPNTNCKAVTAGEQLSDLKSAITSVSNSLNSISEAYNPVNLFDGTEWETDGYFNDSGTFNTASGYKTTAPVFLKAGNYMYNLKYGTYGTASLKVFVCNSEGTVTSVVDGTDTGEKFDTDKNIITFTLPSDCYIRQNMGMTAQASKFMIVAGYDGTAFPMEYQEYFEPYVELNHSLGLTEKMNEELSDVYSAVNILEPAASDSDVGKMLKVKTVADGKVTEYEFGEGLNSISEEHNPVNLFDGTEWGTDGYFDDSGTFNTASGYKTTAPVFLKAGNYMYNLKYGTYGSASLKVFVCNSEGTVTSVVDGTDTGEKFDADKNIITFTLPSDCYIRQNMGTTAQASKFMIVAGYDGTEFPEEYQEYFEPYVALSHDLGLTEKMNEELSDVYSAVNILEPTASDSDVGKMLKVKTVAYGKVTEYEFGEGGSSSTVVSTTVDDALSTESVNPVQNKLVTAAINAVSEPKMSRNIFNGQTWPTNGYFNDSGVFTANDSYRTTAPNYLEAGDYMFNIRKSSIGSAALKVFVVNSTGETVQSVVQGEDSGLFFNENQNIVTFTLVNSCYVRFNMATTNYAQYFMIVRGHDTENYPTQYVPYSAGERTLKSTLGLTDQMKDDVASLKLKGKKLSVNGDSICYGEGYTGGYAKIIGDLYGMTVQNVAVSGGTITAETYSGSSTRHWISRTITSMASDADFAIVEGGVNDAALTASIQLGTLTNDFSSSLDDTTYLGALESTLKQLTTRFAGKKYGFIIVHKASTNFSNMGSDNGNWYWATRKALEKWGVPYLDLNIACPPFGLCSQQYSPELYALAQTYTKNGDGWHPNEEGYKKYYVPKIVAWMNTL